MQGATSTFTARLVRAFLYGTPAVVDFQTLLNVVVGTALAVTGWFARRMWDAMDGLRDDVARLREELPKTYISRDDFKDAVGDLRALLERIDSKLDRKLDKP
jgi:hypothetical protein